MRRLTYIFWPWGEIARLMRENAELREAAGIDERTGLIRNGRFMDMFGKDIYQAFRYGHNVAAGMADIDHFKRVNDEHGHQVGDMILRRVAETGEKAVRFGDYVGRYGGEEFCVAFRDTDETEAYLALERWRSAQASETVPVIGRPVTISGGVVDMYQAPELHLLRGEKGIDAMKFYLDGDSSKAMRVLGNLGSHVSEELTIGMCGSLEGSAVLYMMNNGIEDGLREYLGDQDFRLGVAAQVLLGKADEAMYRAKKAGRNMVFRYSQLDAV